MDSCRYPVKALFALDYRASPRTPGGMNEPSHSILIINHDPNTTSDKASFRRAAEVLAAPGIVPLCPAVYIVSLPEAGKALLELAAIEMRTRETRKLRFCLIPCGSRLFGELPESAVAALGALGLSYSETPCTSARG